MSQHKLTISLSPHVYDRSAVRSIMVDVLIALLPVFLWSIYIFGLDTIRITVLSVSSCILFEYVIQKFILKRSITIDDGSAAVTGLLFAFNLPSHLPGWIIILGCFFCIGVAKMTFGGLGNNPFNPALAGRVFLLASFPAAMTRWPQPLAHRWTFVDAVSQATPLAIVKEKLKDGLAFADISPMLPNYVDLFMGKQGGCLGEISALLLLLGGFYLLAKKVIRWHIPVFVIGTVFIFSALLWQSAPERFAPPLFHLLTGGLFLGAIYMATDLVTSPMTIGGMIIFAIGIGILTVLIRVFGAYPEGMSFAILIMNAFVPLIDQFTKPKKYGKVAHG